MGISTNSVRGSMIASDCMPIAVYPTPSQGKRKTIRRKTTNDPDQILRNLGCMDDPERDAK